MVMEYKHSKMEIVIVETMFMENLMVMVNISGLVEQIIKVNFLMDFDRDKEFG